MGNRLTKAVNGQSETYSYFTGTNLLQDVTGTETTAYSYDANGNITGIADKTLIYNQNNRLIRVEEGGDILGEYTYNGLGQRVIKEVDGVTTVFHYDFNGNIVGESDLSGNFTAEYLYRGKGRMAKVDVGTSTMSYYLNDRLGTPLLMTDETNTVIWEGVYNPFGEADVNPNSSVVNNHRFPGQYYDQETGLHYNYHRFYEPRTGRYITPDPIGLHGGINLFAYALNNPVNSIDTEGLWVIPLLARGAQIAASRIFPRAIPLTPFIPPAINIFDRYFSPWSPGIPEVIEGGKGFRRNYESWKSRQNYNLCESSDMNPYELSPDEIDKINRRAQYLAAEMRARQIQRELEIWYKELE